MSVFRDVPLWYDERGVPSDARDDNCDDRNNESGPNQRDGDDDDGRDDALQKDGIRRKEVELNCRSCHLNFVWIWNNMGTV